MKRMGAVSLLAALACVGCAFEAGPEVEAVAASQEQELAANTLSPEQAATVLRLVDDICGDTWCAGDYNFSFDRLDCRAGCGSRASSCTLTFCMFSYATDLEAGPTFTRRCRTAGFASFDSLVKTLRGRQSLQPDYYDALTECIADVESRLPR